MYYCSWCKTRTQEIIDYPHGGWNGYGCELSEPTSSDRCESCDWQAEKLCPVCEGGVTELEWSKYNRSQDTEKSREMFDGWVSTAELAHILANRMDNKEEFNRDREAGCWVRGNICRALADKGITQKLINFMKS